MNCVPTVEVMSGDVKISVKPSNFNIVNKMGQPAASGEGHIHYFMDVAAPTAPGKPAVTANGTWVTTTDTSYTWHDVSPGMHNFSIELVNNDHTPLNPPVVDTVLINVPVVPMLVPSTPGASPTASPRATTPPVTPPSTSPSPSASPSPGPSPSASPSPTATAVTVNLTARNIAFNTNSITVPAGARVTVNFNNADSGIPHNFSVYNNSSASQAIFTGSIITGPATTTYTFTVPSQPGTYFFRCDVHPTMMTGSFIVQ
jgi:plastocyanin